MISNISVVIPTYKASVFIRKTIVSVFAQTQLPAEVIVVDDCSPDDTVIVVEKIAKDAPVPVRVIRLKQNSGGPAKPLNVGIEAARGDLIATLDHDDQMTPNRLRDQVAAFELCPDVGLVLGKVRVDGLRAGVRSQAAYYSAKILADIKSIEVEPAVFRISSTDAWSAVLAEGSYAVTCSLFMFPKACWQAVGGFDTLNRTACDFAMLEALTRRYDMVFIPTDVAVWSERDQTLTSSTNVCRQHANGMRVFMHMRKYCNTQSLSRQWKSAMRKHFFESGYNFRKARYFSASFQNYTHYVIHTGIDPQIVIEIAKLFGETVIHLFTRK